MKHIAIPSMSVRVRKPYTTAGFGDRVHSATIAYAYGLAHGCSVMLHLTEPMFTGGAPGVDKLRSWQDIVALFPGDSMWIDPHRTNHLGAMASEEWVRHLRLWGIDATCYYYGDTLGMHPYDVAFGVDVAPYLKDIPLLEPIDCPDLRLPSGKFATMQWDAGGQPHCAKRVTPEERHRITDRYIAEGYEMVTVGGEAHSELLRTSPKHVGYAMAKADIHVGVDSGPTHLAHIYMPTDRIHVYTARAESHHVKRWMANGCVRNYHL